MSRLLIVSYAVQGLEGELRVTSGVRWAVDVTMLSDGDTVHWLGADVANHDTVNVVIHGSV